MNSFFRYIIAAVILLFAAKGYSQTFSLQTANGLPTLVNVASAVGDLNADGYPDLVISGTDTGGNPVTQVLTNNKDNTFTDITGGIAQVSGGAIALADLDRDGVLDFVLTGADASGDPVAVYYRSSGGEFPSFDPLTDLEALKDGAIVLEDFNRDGRIDIFLTGVNGSGVRSALLYQNTESGFELKMTGLPAVSEGEVLTLDFNKDGLSDLLLTGLSVSGVKVTKLYENKGNFVFDEFTTSLPALAYSDLVEVDFNNDGYPDIFLTGTGSDNIAFTALYCNNNGSGFFKVTTPLQQVKLSSLSAGDLNNDGYPDLLLTGYENTTGSYLSEGFINSSGTSFSNNDLGLRGIISGESVIADFNADQKADILLIGNTTTGAAAQLYLNQVATANNNPAIPSGLNASPAAEGTVTLSWTASSDAETSANGLSYNVSIGSSSGINDVLTAHADLSTGYYQSNWPGNARQSLSVDLNSLSPGLYYWSVQSLDPSLGYSAFAAEQTFYICEKANAGIDEEICAGDQITLSGAMANGTSFKWYEEGNTTPLQTGTQDLTVTPSTTTRYVFEAMHSSWGCTSTDTVEVVVLESLNSTINGPIQICTGSEWIATATSDVAEFTAEWYVVDGPTETLIGSALELTHTISSTQDIKLVTTNSLTGCRDTDLITVEAWALPEIDLKGDREVCEKDITSFSAGTTWNTVRWYTASEGWISDQPDFDLEVLADETVIVEVTDGNLCASYDTVFVKKFDLPDISLEFDKEICFGTTASFDVGTDWRSVKWYTASGGLVSDQATYEFTVTADETVWVEVENVNSCFNSDTLQVNVLDLPVFDLGADLERCQGEEVLLKAGSGWKQVNWYSTVNGSLADDIWYYQHTVNETDTLIAEVFNDNNCVQYDSVIITMLALPEVNLGPDQSICFGENLELSAGSSGDTVNWYSEFKGLLESNQQQLTLPIFNDEEIWAEVISAKGCTSFDTLLVTVQQLPEYTLGADTAICYNEFLILSPGTGWDAVNWFDLDGNLIQSTPELTVQVTEVSSYISEVYNAAGCFVQDTINVDVLALPGFTLPDDVTVCFGDAYEVTAGEEGHTVNWYVEGNLTVENNRTFSLQITESVTLAAQVINENGCNYYDEMRVEMAPLPQPDAGEDQLICTGNAIQLGTADLSDQGVSFEWTPVEGLDDPTAARPFASPENSTEYIVKVTNALGCFNTDTVSVEVNPENIIDPGQEVAICLGENIRLGGEPTAMGSVFEYTYQWSPEESINDPYSANPIASPDSTTTYTLIVSTGDCYADTAQVTIKVNPLPEVTTSGDVTISAGEDVALQAFGADYYEWIPSYGLDNNLVGNPLANPLTTTTYVVTGYTEEGCTGSDTLTVFVNNQVFVPNLFTPNNDGQNDNFKLYGAGIMELSLQVYTRSGELVYEAADVTEVMESGWDGSQNGTQLPSGNYLWVIQGKFFDGKPVLFQGKNSGTITLMR